MRTREKHQLKGFGGYETFAPDKSDEDRVSQRNLRQVLLQLYIGRFDWICADFLTPRSRCPPPGSDRPDRRPIAYRRPLGFIVLAFETNLAKAGLEGIR